MGLCQVSLVIHGGCLRLGQELQGVTVVCGWGMRPGCVWSTGAMPAKGPTGGRCRLRAGEKIRHPVTGFRHLWALREQEPLEPSGRQVSLMPGGWECPCSAPAVAADPIQAPSRPLPGAPPASGHALPVSSFISQVSAPNRPATCRFLVGMQGGGFHLLLLLRKW